MRQRLSGVGVETSGGSRPPGKGQAQQQQHAVPSCAMLCCAVAHGVLQCSTPNVIPYTGHEAMKAERSQSRRLDFFC